MSLPSPEASWTVAAGNGGIFSVDPPSPVVVDPSTNSVGVTEELFATCAAAGVDFIDCPVSGGSTGAESGALTLMPSGNEAAFNQVKDVLLCFGKEETRWLGPSGTAPC